MGPDYFVRRDGARVAQPLARRVQQLGHEVQMWKAA
jgi:hypothetical protein